MRFDSVVERITYASYTSYVYIYRFKYTIYYLKYLHFINLCHQFREYLIEYLSLLRDNSENFSWNIKQCSMWCD